MTIPKNGSDDPASKNGAASVLALDGCRIERALDYGVEIVEAAPGNRSFPDRLTESFGICVKFGADHDVRAGGRELRYPADAICVRAPGTVWSARATGPVGFLSLDIEPTLLPQGGLVGEMRFVERTALPDLRRCAELLQSDAPMLDRQTVVADLINAVLRAGLVSAPGLDASIGTHAVHRARELLTSRIADPPSLQELADAVGGNRFVLLREFRRTVGIPPHAFVLRLRVDRARTLLARGADISQLAQSLGFADQSHLTRVFKRVVGVSPAAYRRQMRAVVPGSISFKT